MKYKSKWPNMVKPWMILLFLGCLIFPAVTTRADNGVPINSNYFPDNYFRDYIEDTFDADENGWLSYSEIDSVRTININGRTDIASLSGIGYFLMLEKLDCKNCTNITALDLTNNRNLTYLNCERVPLTKLDVSKNTKLEFLNCGMNSRLTSIDVSNNTALKEFYPHNNRLASLDTTHNPELEKLGCQGNRYETIDVSKNTKLTYLSVDYNSNMKSIDVTKNTLLEEFWCTETSISSLDLSRNTNLKKLECHRTNIGSLVVYSSALEVLSCHHTNLQSLDVTRCPNLEELYCEYNKLVYLDLRKNTKLYSLYAQNNRLMALDLSNQKYLVKSWTKLENQVFTLDSRLLDYPSVDADNPQMYLSVSLENIISPFDVSKTENWNGCDVPVNKTIQLSINKSSVSFDYDTDTTYKNSSEKIRMDCTFQYKILSSLTLSRNTIAYDEDNPTVTVKSNTGETLKKDTDYTVSFPKDEKRKIGTNLVRVQGKEDYYRTYIYKSYTITPGKVNNLKILKDTYYYDGTEQQPSVTVTDRKNNTLVQGTDYTVSYENNVNVGTATVTVTGINNYEGTLSEEFEIQAPKLSKATLSTTSYTYNGSARLPSVKVTDSTSKVLKKGTDYTVSYKNNKNVGTATVTVTGMGNYSGKLTATFKINPVATKLTKVSAGKKAFTVYWTKKSTQVTGYEIQYSTSSKFPSKTSKTVQIKSYKTVKTTVKKLSSKKKYYVRIRTYKTVDKKKYTSAWSAVKSVKTK